MRERIRPGRPSRRASPHRAGVLQPGTAHRKQREYAGTPAISRRASYRGPTGRDR